jgi:hypothetical protein
MNRHRQEEEEKEENKTKSGLASFARLTENVTTSVSCWLASTPFLSILYSWIHNLQSS